MRKKKKRRKVTNGRNVLLPHVWGISIALDKNKADLGKSLSEIIVTENADLYQNNPHLMQGIGHDGESPLLNHMCVITELPSVDNARLFGKA